MKGEIEAFLVELRDHRKLASNTLASYRRDLLLAVTFFEQRGLHEWTAVDEYAVMDLLNSQEKAGRSLATVNRLISSLRQFYKYLVRQRLVVRDPMELIDHQKVPPKDRPPVILDEQEIERLLAVPDTTTPLGIRDRAILELLDATGMRVSEVVNLQLTDLHLDVNLVQLHRPNYRERIIPLGRSAVKWLQRYLTNVRPQLVKAATSVVFLNAHGQPMTRQGLWKNFRQWVKAAQIGKAVTPQTIRYSVAVQLLEHGANSQVVQEMLGYSELRMLRPYLKITPQLLTETYQKYHPRA